MTRPFRAIAVGDSYSDPIRVANLIINSDPWDDVILVGDRQGPLYDNLKTVKTPSELPDVDSFDPEKRVLVIFDKTEDNSKETMKFQIDFITRGRMRGVSIFFMGARMRDIPRILRLIADTIYLTSPPFPRDWQAIHKWSGDDHLGQTICFSQRKQWLKLKLGEPEVIEVINASKYYP